MKAPLVGDELKAASDALKNAAIEYASRRDYSSYCTLVEVALAFAETMIKEDTDKIIKSFNNDRRD